MLLQNTPAILAAGAFISLTTSAQAALVSHYTFDNSGALGADSGAFNNTATAGDGDAAFTSSSKVGAGALELDGNDTLFIGGAGADLTNIDDNGSGFTVAAWVNIDPSSTGNTRIMSMAMGAGFITEAWGVGFNGGAGNNMLATTYGQADYPITAPVTKGSWQHVAYRYEFNGGADIDTVEFFLNGISQGTSDPAANGMNNSTGTFSIGNINIPGDEQYFTGLIDDLRVYDAEITDGEILALAAVPEPSSTALLGLGGLALILRRRK